MTRLRKHRLVAFSLVEVLTCVAILAVVAALSFPVFSIAKRRSQMTVSRSDLRQIWMALEMYRSDQGGGGESGAEAAQGLPPVDVYSKMVKDLGLKPPLAGRWPAVGWYYYLLPDPVADDALHIMWGKHLERCGAGAVIAQDLNFSEVGPTDSSPYLSKIGIGVSLSGKVLLQEAPGVPILPGWWRCTPP